jgi:hypothetical protein
MKNIVSKMAVFLLVINLITIILPACTKIKDIEPESELTPATFWKKEDDAIAALSVFM